MKALLKTKESIIYLGIAAVFLLFALTIKWDIQNNLYFFSLPFELVAKQIIKSNNLFAYYIYILFGVLPLVFPIIRIIKTKKTVVRDIAWVMLSVFIFFTLYYFINPHKINLPLPIESQSEAFKEYIKVPLLGMAITTYSVFMVALLLEAHIKFKNKESKVFDYIKIFITMLIVAILFKTLFLNLIDLKALLNQIPKSNELALVNRPLNIFSALFAFLMQLIPSVIAIILFLKAKDFITNLKENSFSKTNIPKLNSIIKTSVILIFSSLLTVVLENLMYFIFSKHLYNSYYRISIPVMEALIACIVLIFSKILIRAILINEENKLVI